jgi:hypothetical protein
VKYRQKISGHCLLFLIGCSLLVYNELKSLPPFKGAVFPLQVYQPDLTDKDFG